MIREPFVNGDSLIHRLDPRLRLVVAAAYTCIVALAVSFPALFVSTGLSLLLTVLAGLNIREVAARAAVVNSLIVLLWLVLPLTFEGEAVFIIGKFAATREGLMLCARITLKSNAILLAFISLIATVKPAVLGHAMHRLFIPEKIIPLLLLTYRYVFVIEEEYLRLTTAAKVRCFQPKSNMHTYRTYSYLIGMLFVRASARAERVYQAMLCRGFKGQFYCLSDFSFTRSDIVGFLVAATAIIGLGILEWINIA